jgi:hypothetical protein
LAVIAAAAAMVAPAGAHAGVLVSSSPSCEDTQSSNPFLRWIDPADYVLNGGGGFESGGAGWTLTGASVVSGNEPWRVTGQDDDTSLRLRPGTSATSSVQCVGLEHPTIRFFAKRSSSGLFDALSTMTVEVLTETSLGLVVSLPIGVVTNTGGWLPTLPFPVLANLLPLLPGDHTPVQFRFTPIGTATWQIDDVYVDPHSRG